jgi:hypothetical protein
MDPRQLYPSKLNFRQVYAFSDLHNLVPGGLRQRFQGGKPASLCFNGGKVIVYVTELPPSFGSLCL